MSKATAETEPKNAEPEKHASFEISAKAVVVGPDGKVLILTRSDREKTDRGKRDLPGGSVEAGETTVAAARREIFEETGLQVSDIMPLPVYSVRDVGSGELQRLRFVAFAESSEVTLDPEEHSAFEWLAFDEAIGSLSDKGYEKDKRDTVIRAKEYLALRGSFDDWNRCRADFDNYRKRKEAEQKEMGRYLVERLVLDLVPVLDNFHAASAHVPEEAKDSPWVTGIGYIGRQFEDTLVANGVTMIEPKEGDDFDPARHEAVGTAEAEESTDNRGQKIAKVLRKGYAMGEKVIRAAQVTVA